MGSVGSVDIQCPQCDAQLSIPVTAQMAGRADNGVVQVDVLTDKVEIQLHALVCTG